MIFEVPVGMMSITPVAHRVAIAGRVAIGFRSAKTDQWTLLPQRLRQAIVELTGTPPGFQRQMALKALSYGSTWEKLPRRPDRAQTAEDGSFYFLDLPAGSYTLRATWPQGHAYLEVAEATVTLAEDNDQPTFIELVLATTGVVGQVTAQSETTANGAGPIALAQVQVVESGAQVLSDRSGTFQLLDLEAPPSSASARSIQLKIAAAGYVSAIPPAIFIHRGTVQAITMQLAPSSP
jgi:hypothetical protein